MQIDQEIDSQELAPAEKGRLASLILRITGHDYGEPGSFLSAHLHRLDRQIKTDDAAARRKHKVHSREAAPIAARLYLQGGITMAEAAVKFGISERSLSRALATLKAITNQYEHHQSRLRP
jgi:hypothetical protein